METFLLPCSRGRMKRYVRAYHRSSPSTSSSSQTCLTKDAPLSKTASSSTLKGKTKKKGTCLNIGRHFTNTALFESHSCQERISPFNTFLYLFLSNLMLLKKNLYSARAITTTLNLDLVKWYNCLTSDILQKKGQL